MTDKGAQYTIVTLSKQLDAAIRSYNHLSAQLHKEEVETSMDDAVLEIENFKSMIKSCHERIREAAEGLALSSQLEDLLDSAEVILATHVTIERDTSQMEPVPTEPAVMKLSDKESVKEGTVKNNGSEVKSKEPQKAVSEKTGTIEKSKHSAKSIKLESVKSKTTKADSVKSKMSKAESIKSLKDSIHRQKEKIAEMEKILAEKAKLDEMQKQLELAAASSMSSKSVKSVQSKHGAQSQSSKQREPAKQQSTFEEESDGHSVDQESDVVTPIDLSLLSHRAEDNVQNPAYMYNHAHQQFQERNLKLMMIQSLVPIKFRGSPRDFPVFRERIRNNLEDGILNEVEQLELLPKFLEGEPLRLLERMIGCTYEDVIKKFEKRFGHPQLVANATVEDLASGPVLGNNDRKGLEEYADRLFAACRVLKGRYLMYASCIVNQARMADRLPAYARLLWEKKVKAICDIKEEGPDLHDLAAFVEHLSGTKNNHIYQANSSGAKTTPNVTKTGSKLSSMTTDLESEAGGEDEPSPSHTVSVSKPVVQRNVKIVSTNQKKPEVNVKSAVSSSNRVEERPGGKRFETSKSNSCKICDKAHEVSDCARFREMDMSTRLRMVRVFKLCFICLRSGCKWDACPKANDSKTCNDCDRRHMKSLIKCFLSSNKPPAKTLEFVPSHSSSTSNGANFMLMTMPVRVHGKDGKSVTTYAFLDTGSRASFIDHRLAEELGITGPTVSKTIRTVMSQHSQQLIKVDFEISGVGCDTRAVVDTDAYIIPGVKLSDHIGTRLKPHEIDVSRHEHLKSIASVDVDRKDVNLLIGLPIQEAHQVLDYRRGKPDEPYGVVTKLGIALAGPVGTSSSTVSCNFTFFQDDDREPTLEELVERLWRLENEQRRPDDDLSPRDQLAVQTFNESVCQLENGHYESRMIWRDPDCTLPYNRRAAVRRLLILKDKFRKEGPNYEAMYRKAMSEYTDNGWAEMIPIKDLYEIGPRTFYLPHFGVTNENKPGKVRCVFDCAAKVDGISLNSALIAGPDSTSSLVGVLLRSRLARYCVAGDVRGMFNQCFVCKQDIDSMRYVWFDGNGDIADFRMLTHTFGKADSPFSANRILKQIALDHGHEYSSDIVEAVNSNFYVDDAMMTNGTVEGSIALASGVTSLLEKGGFELTKFMANDKRILKAFPKSALADPGSLDLDLDPLTSTRALGLQWHLESDSYGYKVQKTDFDLTLRGATSAVARVFDPLGFASPFVLAARRVIQDSWKEHLEWDQPLAPDLAKLFVSWLDHLPNLEKVKIPRRLFPELDDCRENVKNMQLHMFADASEYATGVASYLRAIDNNDRIHCSRIIVGKSKLLPLSPKLTIPRAELKAAVESVRIAEKLKIELPLSIDSFFYWTDSRIVLGYIRNETKKFSTYVANRQSECRRLAPPDRWRHVPGTLNVSDDASRGMELSSIDNSHRYFIGPEFLTKPECEWPAQSVDVTLPSDDPELKASFRENVHSCHTVTNDLCVSNSVLSWIESRSSYELVVKVITHCLRWYQEVKRKMALKAQEEKIQISLSDDCSPVTRSMSKSQRSDESIMTKLISVTELESSELVIIRMIQREHYVDEISGLMDKNFVPRSSSLVSLAPILDSDGTMRVGGRIRNAELPYDTLHPVILPDPKKCQFSAMIVQNYHVKLAHGGRDLIVGALQEKYHIMNVRTFIKQCIRICVLCRRRNARVSTQLMGDLPPDRLKAFEPCFTYCGTDCFGPIICKVGRREALYYGVLMLCMNTKAIHLELVKSLKTDDFLLALMRFIAIRGNVKQIRSDNGSNYVGAARMIREHVGNWNVKQIHDDLRAKAVHWEFQKAYASAQSGIWERRVKETKRHLCAILRGLTPSPDVLRTVFYEVACIMNQVPLVPVSDSIDSYEALTPAHFLFQRPATLLAPVGSESDFSHSRKQWKLVCQLSTAYWNRWLKEYVPSLQKRVKWTTPRRNLSVGDLVTIMEDFLPRSKWIFGRVIETFPDSQGRVRSARVKTQHTEFVRPIQKLALVIETENL